MCLFCDYSPISNCRGEEVGGGGGCQAGEVYSEGVGQRVLNVLAVYLGTLGRRTMAKSLENSEKILKIQMFSVRFATHLVLTANGR